MVDPARVIAANLWIDHLAIFQPEVESVGIIGVVRSAFPRNAFARVFDDAHAFANELDRVDAPTMHSRVANFDPHRRHSSPSFFCHTTCRTSLALPFPLCGILFFDRAAVPLYYFQEDIY